MVNPQESREIFHDFEIWWLVWHWSEQKCWWRRRNDSLNDRLMAAPVMSQPTGLESRQTTTTAQLLRDVAWQKMKSKCVFRMFAIFCNAIQIVPNTKHVAWKWPFCYTFCQQWKLSLITDTYVKWLGGVSTFRDKIHCLTLCAAHLEPRPSCPQIPCLATISKAKHAAWTRSAPMRLLEARYPSSSSKLNSSTPWCLMMFHNVSRVFLGTVIKCCKGCSVERLSASFTGQAGFPLSHWTKRQVDQLKAPRSSVPPIFGAFFLARMKGDAPSMWHILAGRLRDLGRYEGFAPSM